MSQKLLLVLLVGLFSFAGIHAQPERIAVTTTDLNVRAAPTTNSSVLNKVSQNTEFVAEGRDSANQWILGRTRDGNIRGWVSASYLTLNFLIEELPVSEETFGNLIAEGETITAATLGNLLSGGVIRRSSQTFQRGQRLENNPNVLIKIGDSNNAGNQFNATGFGFLCAFTYNAYNLGSYPQFQATLDFFGGSLCTVSAAAQNNFDTGKVLDKSLSPALGCSAEETPLDCAIRTAKPSIAIIYFGLGDIANYTLRDSRENYDLIIETLVGNGVIPVLTTFSLASDHPAAGLAAQYNGVIRTVASVYQVPLVEFQREASKLPNQGTIPGDGYNLSTRSDGVIAFTGEEALFGSTLRHFMTLRILHELYTRVMGG